MTAAFLGSRRALTTTLAASLWLRFEPGLHVVINPQTGQDSRNEAEDHAADEFGGASSPSGETGRCA